MAGCAILTLSGSADRQPLKCNALRKNRLHVCVRGFDQSLQPLKRIELSGQSGNESGETHSPPNSNLSVRNRFALSVAAKRLCFQLIGSHLALMGDSKYRYSGQKHGTHVETQMLIKKNNIYIFLAKEYLQ